VASAIKLRSPSNVAFCALVGLFTTATAIVLAVFPPEDEPNKALAVAKVILLTALVLGSGAAFYYWKRRANRSVQISQ
ncbi:MAG TPA: hypothetical protein VFA29_00055, partial [Candidatus Baltobacteraceae bacterium]|nr:hypothetical protein [Candidatus Baltobacteraceae bacterium]